MSFTRNSLYALTASVLPLVSALVTVPLYIREIGAERYGALVIAWTMLGYFGQADFGIGRALAQRISSNRKASARKMARIVSSGMAILITLGLVMGLVTYLAAAYFFGNVMKVAPALRSELLDSLWALALCNPVMTVTGAATGALIGVERFRRVSIGNLAGNLGLQILPLIAAKAFGHDLEWLIAASLAGRLLGLAIVGTAVWRTFLAGQRFAPGWAEMRRLSRFGIWVMITAMAVPLMIYSDRFVIGAVAGAIAVAVYTIPYQVAYRTLLVPSAIVSVVFPRLAALPDQLAAAKCRAFTIFIAQLFAVIVIGLSCLADPLMHLWLGSHLDPRSVGIARIILPGVWLLAIGSVPFAFIQARGDPRFTAALTIAELPFYGILLFALGQRFGLYGFAAAFSLRALVDFVALSWRAKQGLGTLAGHLMPVSALVLFTAAAAPMFESWERAIAGAFALCSAAAALMFLSLKHFPEEFIEPLVAIPVLGPVFARRVPLHANG
ncbi:flippase [Novosphingobium sp. ZN18A2]|uniref:flippase n=1 Tax=Novosphingobium sp. ZN18A2 TaxID=3079861 RepID=UPI0030CBBD2F